MTGRKTWVVACEFDVIENKYEDKIIDFNEPYKYEYNGRVMESVLISADESEIGETKLVVQMDEIPVTFYYGSKNGTYWFYSGRPGEYTELSYPEETEHNAALIEAVNGDKQLSAAVSSAISYHYHNNGRTDIERILCDSNNRKSRNNIQMILHDGARNVDYYIFNVSYMDDCCLMMCSPEYAGICELSAPMISQMNYYYGHCKNIENSRFNGQNYKKVKKILEKGTRKNEVCM